MRSYGRSGYGSYRGKSKFRTFLKILIAVLVIVLLLLVAGVLLLQRYVVYSADGVRLELPFLGGGGDDDRQPPIIVTTPSPTPIIVTPSPTPEPAPVYDGAVLVPDSLLPNDGVRAVWTGTDGSIKTYTGDSSGARPILLMKGTDGKLGYVSGLQLAKDVKASSGDPERNGDISAATGAGLGTAAYVSCFKDTTAPYNQNALALRTSIGNWRGENDNRWMSPQVEAARQYVVGVCAELAGLGFTEVILDYAAFPTEGDLSRILQGDRYDPASFEATVSGFYREVKEALAPYPDVKLSIVTDKATLTDGVNAQSGQALSALCQYADRIYADLEGESPAAYWEKAGAAGLENPEENLVSILAAPPAGEAGYSWAVLTTP